MPANISEKRNARCGAFFPIAFRRNGSLSFLQWQKRLAVWEPLPPGDVLTCLYGGKEKCAIRHVFPMASRHNGNLRFLQWQKRPDVWGPLSSNRQVMF